MNDQASAAGGAGKADPAARLAQDLALALWQVQMGTSLPKEPEARKAAWKDAKREALRTARATLKRLSKKGVMLVKAEVPA